MRRSRGLTAALILAVTAGLGVGLATTDRADAVTPPVAFTADNLPTWQTNGIVWSLAEANGTVFVGGTFSEVRPPEGTSGTAKKAVNFAAMNAATGKPTGCSLSFTIGTGTATVRALTVSPDKKTLYAGGYFGAVNGTKVSSLAAIDIATCKAKTGFKASFPSTVRALAATSDTVYAGGDFHSAGGVKRERFAAVDATSGKVKAFKADADQPGRAVDVTSDGKHVALGGDFFTVNGADSHALAVVDATTGANKKTYPLGFISKTSVVKDVEADSTGFYTGNEGTGGGVFDGRIAVDNGTFNQRWRDTCLGATQAVKSYKNVLYSASHAHDCSSMGEFPDGRRHHLMAQRTDDPKLLGWFPDTNDGLGEKIGPRALAISTKTDTKYLWVGGEFTTVNGGKAQGLSRFASGPDTGKPTIPQASATSTAPDKVKVSWRSSTDLDDSKLTYKVYRNGGTSPVHTVSGESFEWSRPQLSFTDTNVKAGSTYTYQVTATDAAGNTSTKSAAVKVTVPTAAAKYPSAVGADGAELYWRYDDPSTPFAADSSAKDNSGVYVGGPTLGRNQAALNGDTGAVALDGAQQKVYSDQATTVDGAFTLETWFRTSSARGGKLLGFGDRTTAASGRYDKHLYLTNDGKAVFGVYSGGARTLSSDSGLNDGKWHHAVGTQGPDGMALYVDGKQVGSNDVTGNQKYSGYWHAGGDNLNGWPEQPSSSFLAGQLDETAVYGSALSAARVRAHFTAASAPSDTVRTVAATEDAYANAGAPGTNYGSSASLAVRGTSAYLAYLRFDLPAAPAGTELKSARLTVKTSTQSGAESADTPSVVPVTGEWSESGVTYKNRPSLAGKPIGSFDATESAATPYTASLDTAALADHLGTSYSVALTGEGSDALWLWSREAAAAGGTPQLDLTFGTP
ncbi:DNRLRE domain-containing protein [Streptomyces sp. NPDC058045]|uniref:CBM96 family carbohydrate-binding protein n=1 Tax=Streptomyces sp. NPDC058045 TaxID=3346311 RepID=UPI0036E49621